MSQKTKTILVILGVLLASLILFLLFGWVAGTIAAILGGGKAKKLLQDYVKVERKREEEEARAVEEERRKVAQLIAKDVNLNHVREKIKQRESGEHETINKARTTEELDVIQQKQLERAERWLDAQGGHIETLLLSAVIGLLVFLFTVYAFAAPKLADSKATAHRTASIIARYQAFIVKLKKQNLSLQKEVLEANTRIKQLQARLQEERKKKELIASIPCPPTWPYVVGSVAASALVLIPIGAAIGWSSKKP